MSLFRRFDANADKLALVFGGLDLLGAAANKNAMMGSAPMSTMPNDEAEHWRALAQQALVEAEVTVDPRVQDALRSMAREYIALAEKAEARRKPAATQEP